MDTRTIDELHTEHVDWLSKLQFYADEIKLMKERIGEAASANTSKEVLAQVEHFQNQLIVQKNNIDTLRLEVNDHENYLENRVDENPVAAGKRKVHDHPLLRDKMESFETQFNALRKELQAFQAKVY